MRVAVTPESQSSPCAAIVVQDLFGHCDEGDSQVIEEALRRDLGLDLLERLWAKNDLREDEAMALAVEARRATRSGEH